MVPHYFSVRKNGRREIVRFEQALPRNKRQRTCASSRKIFEVYTLYGLQIKTKEDKGLLLNCKKTLPF